MKRILLLLAALLLTLCLCACQEEQDVPQDTDTTPTETDTPTATDTPHKTTYRFDENGLLLYDTYGHYVQAERYDGAEIPWQLLLVNDWNPLPEGYDEALTLATEGSQTVDERMAGELEQMLAAGSAYDIQVVSGYRAAALQNTLYWNKVAQYTDKGYNDLDAQLEGGTVVKRPGFSEHNSGLAVDLGGSGDFSLEESFAGTEAYAWLIDHCADYGFILRFPQGKEDITGVIYEPWHYRYVGTEAAQAIMSGGLCLEEYLETSGL